MCDHNGTSRGELRLDSRRAMLIAVIVCDQCNQLVATVGSLEYVPNPNVNGNGTHGQ
jgi:hypothetical protein